MFEEHELVFEITQDETILRDGENVATGQEALPEIKIKDEYHKPLLKAVCDLKSMIQKNQVNFNLLKAIHTLQRLNEKLIGEV